jgi:hypothetical protein
MRSGFDFSLRLFSLRPLLQFWVLCRRGTPFPYFFAQSIPII